MDLSTLFGGHFNPDPRAAAQAVCNCGDPAYAFYNGTPMCYRHWTHSPEVARATTNQEPTSQDWAGMLNANRQP